MQTFTCLQQKPSLRSSNVKTFLFCRERIRVYTAREPYTLKMETIYSFASLVGARTHADTSDYAVTNPKRKYTFLRFYYLNTSLMELPFYICVQKI